MLEAPSGFEPEMEVLQTSALPLGYGAPDSVGVRIDPIPGRRPTKNAPGGASLAGRTSNSHGERGGGAGNGIRTRDFDLGKVALYH